MSLFLYICGGAGGGTCMCACGCVMAMHEKVKEQLSLHLRCSGRILRQHVNPWGHLTDSKELFLSHNLKILFGSWLLIPGALGLWQHDDRRM